MKQLIYFLTWMGFFLCLSMSFSNAQSGTNDALKVELHGFINHEIIYDSRQSVISREGEVLFFPNPVVPDKFGKDKNDYGELSMFNYHTRLKTVVSGFSAGNFNVSGLVEGDFLGSSNTALNMVRLRHAFIKLSNEKCEFLIGQYWHPAFVAECYPDVVQWNVGLPVHILNRAPQIRVTFKPSGKMAFMAAAVSQRDYASSGPAGVSSVYLKRSGVPDMQFQAVFTPANNLLFGFTAGYKTIVPRIATDSLLSHQESIGGYNLNAFVRVKTPKLTCLLQGIYGQNLSHFTMLGGYAVKSVDPDNDFRQYTNINSGSVWTDVSCVVSNRLKAGIFAGYVKNMGSSEEVEILDKKNIYGYGTDIDHVISISPRISYEIGKLRFAIEWNHLMAAYGAIQQDLTVDHTTDAVNNRFLFSTFFNF